LLLWLHPEHGFTDSRALTLCFHEEEARVVIACRAPDSRRPKLLQLGDQQLVRHGL
jgi:hypothetical protein